MSLLQNVSSLWSSNGGLSRVTRFMKKCKKLRSHDSKLGYGEAVADLEHSQTYYRSAFAKTYRIE